MKLIFMISIFLLIVGCTEEKIEAKKYGAVESEEKAVELAKLHFKNDFQMCGNSFEIYRIQSWDTELEACPGKSSFTVEESKVCFRDGYQIDFTITDTEAVSSSLSKGCLQWFYVEIAKNDGETMNYSYEKWL